MNGRPDVLIAGTYGKYSGLHLLKKVAGRWPVSYTHLDVYKRQEAPRLSNDQESLKWTCWNA